MQRLLHIIGSVFLVLILIGGNPDNYRDEKIKERFSLTLIYDSSFNIPLFDDGKLFFKNLGQNGESKFDSSGKNKIHTYGNLRSGDYTVNVPSKFFAPEEFNFTLHKDTSIFISQSYQFADIITESELSECDSIEFVSIESGCGYYMERKFLLLKSKNGYELVDRTEKTSESIVNMDLTRTIYKCSERYAITIEKGKVFSAVIIKDLFEMQKTMRKSINEEKKSARPVRSSSSNKFYLKSGNIIVAFENRGMYYDFRKKYLN